MNFKKSIFFVLAVWLAAVILSACSPSDLNPGAQASVTAAAQTIGTPLAAASATPFLPVPISPTPEPPTPTATPDTLRLAIDPAVPRALADSLSLQDAVSEANPTQAQLLVQVGDQQVVAHWVYALAAPFPSLLDGITTQDLRRTWRGEQTDALAGRKLLMTMETLQAWQAYWGNADPGAVKIVGADELLNYAWDRQPAFAILPFGALEPRWKALEIDGISPLRNEFSAEDPQYPLNLPISALTQTDQARAWLAAHLPGSPSQFLPLSNRDPGRLTTVALTGVTALVRATANTMEIQGITYPARDIGGILRSADIAHVSNEVPFARNCPTPNPTQPSLRFCSDSRYIGLLEEVGTDVVELTGDHFADWGAEAMLYTLDLYRERGWGYYGGGENLADGLKPLLLEHNGNKIAFIGCNAKGGIYASADANTPGAAYCDFPYMENEIKRLVKEDYLVIATFQHFEYYSYPARPNQLEDFRRLVEAGAVLVSGSQAHHPQVMEFYKGRFIHYGLGNLFFDQIDVSENTGKGFIDRHVFYNGRYIGVELIPIQFVDYARPRLMTETEREAFLGEVFDASGW